MEKVLLLFPRSGEERWKGVKLPPSAAFLSGGLREEGFHSDFSYLEIPSLELTPPRSLEDYFAVGLSLFDDFLPEVYAFVQSIPQETLVALGGITATMAPREVFQIFGRANLVFPGEGDREFARVLSSLREGKFPEGPWGIRWMSREKMPHPEPVRENLANTLLDLSLLGEGGELELVLTRGCPRSCIFCTHPHGRVQRRTPLSLVRAWMREYRRRGGRRINLADDDILLHPEYAREVFRIMGEEGVEVWGIQTSMDSLRDPLALEVLEEVPFASGPVVWIGTDAFISPRARRLAKRAREEEIFAVVKELEERGMGNYHYWILSDCQSTLGEFAREFSVVGRLMRDFSRFHLLPNSPFLIPYPYTPSYKRALLKCSERVVYREVLRKNGVEYPLVLYEKPASSALYHFLNPEKTLIPWMRAGEFLARLKEGDLYGASSLLLSLLREEGEDPSPLYSVFEK